MACTVTADGPCRRTLAFSIDRSVLDQEVDGRLEEIARTSRFKGFRPGKVPRDLVRKTHGAQLREEARRKVMGQAFREAVQEHELHPVGDPEMNLEVLKDEEGGAFEFEFAVEVIPDFELDIPEAFPVTVTLAQIDDAMVEREREALLERFATLEDAAEGAEVAQNDILEGTCVYVVDGDELEPRTERPVFTKHDLVDGLRQEGLAQAFLGQKQGDTVELEVELPAHFKPEEHAGKSATLRYTIDRHRLVKLPEVTEELLQQIGAESEDDLLQKIRQGLEGQRAQAYRSQVDAAIDADLLERHSFELPERLAAKTVDHKVHELAHKLMKEQGMSSEEGHEKAEEHRTDAEAATQKGLRLAFIVARLAKLHELGATAEETTEQVRTLAQAQGQDPDEALRASLQEGWINDVQEQLTQEKVRGFLRNLADVTEQTPDEASDED